MAQHRPSLVCGKGAKGAAVTLLQTLLREVGFNKDGSRTPADGDWKGVPYRRTYPIGTLATDADFGGATDKALRAFQTAEAITSDGIAGPTTWSRLGETGLPCTSGSASGGSGGSGGSGPASKTYVSPSGEILPTGFETPFYQQNVVLLERGAWWGCNHSCFAVAQRKEIMGDAGAKAYAEWHWGIPHESVGKLGGCAGRWNDRPRWPRHRDRPPGRTCIFVSHTREKTPWSSSIERRPMVHTSSLIRSILTSGSTSFLTPRSPSGCVRSLLQKATHFKQEQPLQGNASLNKAAKAGWREARHWYGRLSRTST